MLLGNKISVWNWLTKVLGLFFDNIKWILGVVIISPILTQLGLFLLSNDSAFFIKVNNAFASGSSPLTRLLNTLYTMYSVFWIVAVCVFIVFLLGYCARFITRWRGGVEFRGDRHGKLYFKDRIALETFFTGLNPIHHFMVTKEIHCFQHDFEKYARLLRCGRKEDNNLENETFLMGIKDLLVKSKKIIDQSTQADVAVHIKLFTKDNLKGTLPKIIQLQNVKLRTYCRCPSRSDRHKLRENKEFFKISTTCLIDQIDYIKKIKDNYKRFEPNDYNLKKSRVNSAYDYVLQSMDRFFVCNDLEEAERKNVFYSNSIGWDRFYNSLAVFLIHPHIDPGVKLDDEQRAPHGLLIIDSKTTGRLDSEAMRIIGGYLAHRYCDYFDLIRQ